MSTGYSWEDVRQVCATLLGARHVPERLCSGPCPQRGAIASARPYLTLPYLTCCSCLSDTLQICLRLHYVISNWVWMRFGGIVPPVNAHCFPECDFWYDVILSRWRPWRFSSLSSVCRLPASPPSTCDVMGSLYVLQFLIHSTLILVLQQLSLSEFIHVLPSPHGRTYFNSCTLDGYSVIQPGASYYYSRM